MCSSGPMRPQSHRPIRTGQTTRTQLGVVVFLWLCGWASAVPAQTPPRVHYLHHEFLPPGVIGQEQLRRNPSIPGYYQAVELMVPSGTHVSIVEGGTFGESRPGPVLAGMQVGGVYSIKLSQLPNREGVELFPTIEIINRLYPPEGTKTRFPIPIEITEDDIAQALSGLYVMRVVYLEDSDNAFPRADNPREQRSIDVSPREDPLHVADRMGRPMAIVRLGSRIPDLNDANASCFASPPVLIYPPPKLPANPVHVKDAIERQGGDIPREAE